MQLYFNTKYVWKELDSHLKTTINLHLNNFITYQFCNFTLSFVVSLLKGKSNFLQYILAGL